MPALFSVALAPALHDLHRELRPTEQVLAYLDDVYILASPDRVALLYRRLEELIWQRARLRLNASKTRVWNAAGVLPTAVLQLAPESQVWVGDLALSPEQRGLVALGVPIGSPAFIESHLQQSLARQTGLLQALPPYTTLRSVGCSSRAVQRHERSMRSGLSRQKPQGPTLPRTMTQYSPALTHCCALRPQGGCPYLPLLGPCLAPWGLGPSQCSTPCTGRLLVFLGRRAACHCLSGSSLCTRSRRHSRGGFACTRGPPVAPPRSCLFDCVRVCASVLAPAVEYVGSER